MGLKITDGMILKAQYELEQLQPEDSVYDIIETIIIDESIDDYTRGYLTARLETWSESMSEKELMEEFIWFAKRIKN